MKKILFTGGGSAGHVVPNLALIETLLKTGEADVYYMGTAGVERELIARYKIPFYQIECPKLVRGGLRAIKRNFTIPFRLQKAKRQALEGLRQIQPNLVFSKGGYVSLPVVNAAYKLGIPCVSHESDLSAGLANRLMAKKCRYICTSFPETAKSFRCGVYTGAPMRTSLFCENTALARRRLDIPDGKTVLLIFGGGSGSARINEGVRKHLKTLTERYFLLHVCGRGNVVESNVKNYRQFEFIADMGMAYAAADGIISRAGAGAVFEIMALKKPALLIPLEEQTRGDQLQNAGYFEDRGMCHILRQDKLEDLPQAIEKLFADGAIQSRLLESHYTAGNAAILRIIRQILR